MFNINIIPKKVFWFKRRIQSAIETHLIEYRRYGQQQTDYISCLSSRQSPGSGRSTACAGKTSGKLNLPFGLERPRKRKPYPTDHPRSIPCSPKRSRKSPTPGEYVFMNPAKDKPYVYRHQLMRILCDKAGVMLFNYHNLRHFGASLLASRNVPKLDIQGNPWTFQPDDDRHLHPKFAVEFARSMKELEDV